MSTSQCWGEVIHVESAQSRARLSLSAQEALAVIVCRILPDAERSWFPSTSESNSHPLFLLEPIAPRLDPRCPSGILG
jgi:hypothetical protein